MNTAANPTESEIASMEAATTTLCNAVAHAVIATGVVHKGNLDRASEVMKAETSAFLWGEKYADLRATVAARTVSDAYALSLVVANCVFALVTEANA